MDGNGEDDPFAILGLSVPTADQKEIKRAYKRMALKFHPGTLRTDVVGFFNEFDCVCLDECGVLTLAALVGDDSFLSGALWVQLCYALLTPTSLRVEGGKLYSLRFG